MIKATIQNSPYCAEIRFPCSETELSKKLGELGMNTEHLAPVGTIIEIEPVELSVLEDCDVSLDALNYLGKRMDGMCKAERNQFLAVLSCDELEIGYGLKNMINLCRLGAGSVMDCKITADLIRDVSDEWTEKISEVVKMKDLFGLNTMLKNEGVRLKQEQPVNIFYKELSRVLVQNDFAVSENKDCITVFSDSNEVAKLFDDGMMSAPGDTANDAYYEIKEIARTVSEYCSAYEKAAPLKAEDLSEKYRCFAEFNGTVLAAKYNEEYGFEFVTWDRTFDGKGITQKG